MFIDKLEFIDKKYLAIDTLAEYYSRKNETPYESVYKNISKWEEVHIKNALESEIGVFARIN